MYEFEKHYEDTKSENYRFYVRRKDAHGGIPDIGPDMRLKREDTNENWMRFDEQTVGVSEFKCGCVHANVYNLSCASTYVYKGSKDDAIINSKEVDQEDELEANKCKRDTAFVSMLDEEQKVLVWEYVCWSRDALLFEEGGPIPAWLKEREETLKYDETVRRKIMKELEEEDFDLF
ncbi:hypothetical protein FNV43_RR17064 [Rhamnella rubrinervis]|uniref:Uncharacterized protein n=1 Tax=Rhamnella rubrinervis TaxID=2594499 RepID=A0A8K0H024_9ROSA|nr:hypothetical protein FNV43_RR17064 [Rhamnella rubrinervis]